MSQDNTITVRGYVTAEPKMWQRTPEQSPVATIRVGSTPRKLNRETGEWQDGETSYYTVKCWRKLAENVHGSLRKGDMVIVRGQGLHPELAGRPAAGPDGGADRGGLGGA